MYDRDLFARVAEPYGVEVTAELTERLGIYARLLVEWNEKMNLTGITDPYGVTVKHMADSLQLLPLLPDGAFSLIDVGTGAGFPGMPLLILRPDLEMTFLDALNKRILFLEDALGRLGLTATTLHARAEDAARMPDHRERKQLLRDIPLQTDPFL